MGLLLGKETFVHSYFSWKQQSGKQVFPMILIKVPFQSVGSNSVQMLLFYLLAHFKGYVNTKWNLALINVINGTCIYQQFVANMAA